MSVATREEIKNVVQGKMTPRRFDHTLSVAKMAKDLARVHGVDEENAEIVGLIHDVAQEFNAKQIRGMLMLENQLEILKCDASLWHAPMGAIIAKATFSVYDSDMLHAIKYHVTGRPEMSELEKVLFVANVIEPNRTCPMSARVRAVYEASGDLNAAVCEVLKQKNIKSPDAQAALAYYEAKTGNGMTHTG